MKTKREITFDAWRELHALRIPEGVPVQEIKGSGFAVLPQFVDLQSKTENLFRHDSTYYYIWIDEKDVDHD